MVHQYILSKNVFNIFNLSITIIKNLIVTEIMSVLLLQNNSFSFNYVSQNGSCIFILNSNSTGEIQIFNNNFSYNLGSSVIHLNNPANIIIENCNFISNNGKIGTSIYYSENFNYPYMKLFDNRFINNFALFGGDGLYLENNFYNFFPNSANSFIGNKAYYGNNFITSPFRLKLMNKKTNENYKIIPGISQLSFDFSIIDYYNSIVFVNTTSSIRIMKYKKKIFSEIKDLLNLKIDGQTSIVVVNGQ